MRLRSAPALVWAQIAGMMTGLITWAELQPFFARGALLSVQPGEDMVGVALAMAENDQARLRDWLQGGQLVRLSDDQAQDWQARDPLLWAVVVAPWVLVQERTTAAALH